MLSVKYKMDINFHKGWHDFMNKIRSLKSTLDIDIHCETTYALCQKYILEGGNSAYIQGILAAIRLYEKTKFIPDKSE
jgi:hypothetical protein